jgi:MarR family transcriptional regulator, 2-MHQ and catechol-resistance regulon repressor
VTVVDKCDDVRIQTFGVFLEALTRLNQRFDRSLRERVGISIAWFEALLRIERSGGHMTMGSLADQIALTSGGVTRLVDRLVEEELVERQACATDRRVLYVALTEAGRDKLSVAVDVHLADLDAQLMSRISEEERRMLVTVMERLRAPVDQPIPV